MATWLAKKGRKKKSSGYSGPPPTMAFEFNETEGTTLTDSVGGRTCSLGTGIVLADLGDGRRGVDFQGATHAGMLVSGSTEFCPAATPWSIELLVMLDAFTDQHPVLMTLKSNVINNPFTILVTRTAQYYGLCFGSASRHARIRTGTSVEDGNAFVGITKHIIITYSGGGLLVLNSYTVQIEGETPSLYAAGTFAAYLNVTKIGAGNATNSQFDGKMNFIRYYDYLLSPEQKTALYNAR